MIISLNINDSKSFTYSFFHNENLFMFHTLWLSHGLRISSLFQISFTREYDVYNDIFGSVTITTNNRENYDKFLTTNFKKIKIIEHISMTNTMSYMLAFFKVNSLIKYES